MLILSDADPVGCCRYFLLGYLLTIPLIRGMHMTDIPALDWLIAYVKDAMRVLRVFSDLLLCKLFRSVIYTSILPVMRGPDIENSPV
jgi:hypothetical protein